MQHSQRTACLLSKIYAVNTGQPRGAQNRNRTCTSLLIPDFESDASTSSAIWARSAKLNNPRRTSKEESTKTKGKNMLNDQGPSPGSGTSYGGVSNGSSSGIQSGSSSGNNGSSGSRGGISSGSGCEGNSGGGVGFFFCMKILVNIWMDRLRVQQHASWPLPTKNRDAS